MTVLGCDTETGEFISLDSDARSRGVYVVGSTGTGKTTFLQSVAFQDMKAGHGLCVLDPHGDMIDWLLERVPPERVDDVILIDPADVDRPIGLNLLDCDRTDPLQVQWVVSTLIVTLRRLFAHTWGARLEHVLGHTLWSAMAIPGSTLYEVLRLLTDEEYRDRMTEPLSEPLLKAFWRELPRGFRPRHEMISSTVNKLTPFLLDPFMRNIVAQTKSTLDVHEVMDRRQILLVNLSKGDLGENNSSLLGSVLINLILIAALRRRDVSPEKRQENPFHVIVDEYQNFASESFAVLQSEARKYAVDLVVAHQFRDQLTEQSRGSALNVGNFVFFRVTGVDGPELAAQFDNTPPQPDPVWEAIREPSSQWPGLYGRGALDRMVPGPQRLYSDVLMQTANELANLVLFQARARIIEREKGRPRLAEYRLDCPNPHDPKLAPDFFGVPDRGVAERIRRQSRRLTRSREEVEAEINCRTGDAGYSPAQTAQRMSDS